MNAFRAVRRILLLCTLVIAGVFIGVSPAMAAPELTGGHDTPTIEVWKTVTATYDKEYTWEIDKSVLPVSQSAFIGDQVNYTWKVTLTKSATYTKKNFLVTGKIYVKNNKSSSKTGTLTDVLDDGTVATITGCTGSGVTFTPPSTLKINGYKTAECTYTASPSDTDAYKNYAKFKVDGTTYTGYKSFSWSHNWVNKEVVVDDDQYDQFPKNKTDSDSWTYQDKHGHLCSSDISQYEGDGKYEYTDVNTATVKATGGTLLDSATATATVTCYAPVVSKTANASSIVTNTWTIDKQADGTYSKFIGDAATTHNYTVSVDKSVEESFAVAGTINVANPAGSPGEITVSLADSVGGTPATLSCDGSLTVPVGESRSCDYTAALGSATNGTNTATATFKSINFPATANYVFGAPTVVGPATINVTDNDVALGSTSVATSWPYTRDFVCPTDPAAYTNGVKVMDDFVNTAKIVETNQTDTATVKLTCYAPVVSKSASTEWTRAYTWGITKDVVPAAHSGYPGDNFSSDYTVSVDQTVTDSGYRAFGTINVSNPAGSPGAISVNVTDAVNGSAAVVDCDAIAAGNQGSVSVNVGESMACSYSVDLPDNTNLTNTAQVSFNQINFAATAAVTFGDPTIVGFPTINVSDFFNGDVVGEALGAASGDATFPYFRNFVCPTEESAYTGGLYNQVFPNTAKIVETGQSDDASVTVSCELRAGLGDLVWHDLNADGVQNDGSPSQPGVSGVTVNLLNGACEVPLGPSDVTDANGLYSILNLDAGDYCVQFVIPAGYVVSGQNVGADDSVDSDGDSVTGKSAPVTLAAGEFNPTLDLGLYKLAKLGDRVWVDDGNGVQDANEPNVPGVTVTLFSCADALGSNPLATDVTDENGLYLFDNLMPGCYYVIFSLPPAYAGYTFTTPNSGADDALDSDADATGKSEQVTLASGDENLTLDAGIVAPTTPVVPLASLGDRVWVDDGNGVQDANEPNVPGVTVTLYACTDTLATTPLATDVTDENGLYLFDNLAAGCYYVIFSLPSGYTFTTPNVGENALDSDADATGRSEEVTLAPGDAYRDLDAGIVAQTTPVVLLASLGDRVWEDDGNGVQDANEPNVPNVTVTLFACTDTLATTPLATDVTDENGVYLFDNLAAGCYYVIFTLPAEYEKFTTPNVGDNALDSDADATGRSEEVTLAPGDAYRDLDAGLVAPVDVIVEPPTDPTGLPEGDQPLAKQYIFLPTLRHEQ